MFETPVRETPAPMTVLLLDDESMVTALPSTVLYGVPESVMPVPMAMFDVVDAATELL